MAAHPAVAAAPRESLLSLWAALGARIQQEGIVDRLGNLPANLAEHLVARWSGATVQHGSNPAVDVIADATRYQVKCLRRTDPGRNSVTTLPATFAFDELIIIVFEYDLSLCVGLRVNASDLARYADALMTGAAKRRITLTLRFCSHPAVRQIPRKELECVHPFPPVVAWQRPRWLPDAGAAGQS
jgi:hypothetical protein